MHHTPGQNVADFLTTVIGSSSQEQLILWGEKKVSVFNSFHIPVLVIHCWSRGPVRDTFLISVKVTLSGCTVSQFTIYFASPGK